MRSELPFFLLKGEAQSGPYTLSQLRSMWGHGAITADTFYWQEGHPEWLPISTILDELEQTSSRALVPSVGFSGDRDRPPPIPVSRRTCLFCAEPIADTAMKCRHCGETLDPRLRAAEEASKAAALVAAAPKFRPRNANACPVCAGAVAPSAPTCPQCGHRLKLGCLAKLAIGAGALIALFVLLAIIADVLSPSEGQHSSAEAPSESALASTMPASEAALISTVQTYVARYASARNELQKSTVRTERQASLAQLMTSMEVSDWVGTLKEMTTDSEGKASIEIQLSGSPISVHTDIGNPFERGSDTSIEHGSVLYNQLSAMSVGDPVKFSGSFMPGEQDHIKETSITESGAMTEPEFVMRFSSVTPAKATSSAPNASPSAPDTASPAPEASSEPMPPAAASQVPTTSSSLEMPAEETALTSLVQSYLARYTSAPNELQKSTVRTERRAALAKLMPGVEVSNWIGTLKKMSTYSHGKASIEIELSGSPISVQTDIGNPFEPGSDTSIEHGSVLYNQLSAMSVGDPVKFSGSFVPGEQDHFKETSITESGSMTEPEFVMRFSEVTPARAASSAPNASPTPLASQAEAQPEETAPPTALAATSPAPGATSEPVPSAAASPTPPSTEDLAGKSFFATPAPVPSAAASPAPTLPVGEAPSPTSMEHISCSVVGVPDGDALNVHSGPNSKSQVVAKLPNGYPDAQIVGQPVMNGKTEWVEIKFGDGTGWVTTKYLSRLPANGPDAAPTTPVPAPTPAGPLLRFKLFEDEAHTCRLLLPEDGWVPIESPPRGVTLALEGPGGTRVGVRHLDGAVGERSLAVMFARELKERFPFDEMKIKPTEPNDHFTIGTRTGLHLSAQSSDPMQRMLQDMPDGPMKQGMLAGSAAAGPKNLTFFAWSVISEGAAMWVVESEDTISFGTPEEIRSKTGSAQTRLIEKLKMSPQFETDPVGVYSAVRGYAFGLLVWAIKEWSFDADGLTPVIDQDKQAADPKVIEDWNLIMDAQTW